ncbi:hypothetical protein RF11_01250 [Thelohanellus kitauei]|uniref:MD-2-related lipid-recognition domain-containing protein n=1 Tax=Thelohanellus kitauei TaxID=669202 RepID=A0A0C2JZ69_THEKT|nr:hypothetical protein RF11_01250 [Thelohanellus kitauei]
MFMAIKSIPICLAVSIMFAMFGFSYQQAYRCRLPVGDSSYHLISATITGCSEKVCGHYNYRPQSLNMTFTPFTKSDTIKLVAEAYDDDDISENLIVEHDDFCSQEGVMCPIYPGGIYTVNIRFEVSSITSIYQVWSSFRLVGDDGQTVGCLRILSAREEYLPGKPTC